VRATLEAHLGSRQVARVVYGSIIGLALVIVVEAHPPRTVVVIGWLLGTAVAVALAELYSEIIGVETRERHRVTRPQVVEMLDDAGAVAFGVAFPIVFFVLALLGVLELGTAFTIAKWTGLALIGFYGYWAARFSGAPVPRALLQGAAVALVGGALIALKAFLH
jgi:VIT1/CCC1 family predicted Fe2+/Mn2+ transporter